MTMERELYLVNGMRAPAMLDRTQRCWRSVVVLIAISGCTEPMQAEPGDTNGIGGAAAAGTAGTGGAVAAGGIGGWATSPPSCQVVEFAVPTADCNPHAITRGPDGNVWFTEWAGNKVGRITPAGTITEFRIPFQSGAEDITAGPDGNVWFSEWGYGLNSDNNVGRVTPTGVITEFPVGGGAQTWPFGITTGPDGNLWFTEFAAKRIGRMNRSGSELTEFPFPEPGSLAEALCQGDVYNDENHEVDEWNQQKDQPPDWLADDLEQNHAIVDGNDRCPSRLAGLRVYLPQRSDQGHRDRQHYDQRYDANRTA